MVRFQADAGLNQIIVAAVVRRDPAVDFRTAAVAALEGMSDVQGARVRSSDWPD